MADAANPLTSLTLLGRLQRSAVDQEAWRGFLDRYGPIVLRWGKRWGLQDSDARDVTQDVMMRVVRRVGAYRHRGAGSFRGWLRTIAHGAYCDCVAERNRGGAGSGDTARIETLNSVAAREDLLKRLDDEFDCELLERAMTAVRERVKPHTWEAFRLMAVEGVSGADVAARLGMEVGTVFVAKSKVQRMIQEEIRRLDEDGAA